MSILDDLLQSARALEGAALALSHCLRPSTKRTNPSPALMETFRECEAFAITKQAVMEEAKPILPLLSDTSSCIGRSPRLTTGSSRVCNGFDSLALVLVTLFDASTSSILEVAGNHTRWLVSPLQAIGSGLDRVQAHHGQLRAMYGIIHMAGKIVTHVDVSKTLFVEVSGSNAHPELKPARWRAAIKMDDFYGRHFGFHYSPEMRNVLRVVNIARESVSKSHAAEGAGASPLVQNMSMLGWGWVYSNMVLMNNLGLPIDAVNQIGADNQKERVSIAALRKFMNLVEEPFVAGVSGLASVDVAIDRTFSIPEPGADDGLEGVESGTHSEELRKVLRTVCEPVNVRLMSGKTRRVELPSGAKESRKMKFGVGGGGDGGRGAEFEMVNRSSSTASLSAECERGLDGTRNEGVEMRVRQDGNLEMAGEGRKSGKEKSTGGSDNSFLASTIKTELIKLHSNVSSFLGMEEAAPAAGLIMHFHGGGFVSQSSTGHAAYMKEWCARIPEAVLLSIDYKLAPEYKFPIAVHECVYAYIWALRNAERLGCRAERVVFAGDSAGGNLAIATAMKLGELGLREPDGICIAYPALHVKVAWSASRLLSFFDPMLPLSVLELCVKSYVPEGMGDEALVSPVRGSLESLRRLPRMSMICGSLDPLLDDAMMFAQKMKDAGREGRGDVVQIYDSMPHGFLNMSLVNESARDGVLFLARMIAEDLQLAYRTKINL